MRGGRPQSVLLAAAAMAVSGMGVSVIGAGENLAPAGRRERRIFGYENIRRHLQRQKRTWGATGSIAGLGHANEREIARRLRQAARDVANRETRVMPSHLAYMPPEATGISRRGRWVVSA